MKPDSMEILIVNCVNFVFMFQQIYFLGLFIQCFQPIMGQEKLIGVYELRGIHEMAAAFNFTEDGKFEFYYSYGAVDRSATGSYELKGDTVKLMSNKLAGNDFKIETQKKQGAGYQLKFRNDNPYLLKNIKCICFQGSETREYFTDDSGILIIPELAIDKIYAQHQLFPDIVTLIKDTSNSNNYFELSLLPSLGQVSFKGIDLILKEDALHMQPNYFMMFLDIRFVKSD